MKILTVNFLTCAVKACKSSPLSFPLHFQDAELEQSDIEYNPSFLRNVLPRVDWEALKVTANEVRILLSSLLYHQSHSWHFCSCYLSCFANLSVVYAFVVAVEVFSVVKILGTVV